MKNKLIASIITMGVAFAASLSFSQAIVVNGEDSNGLGGTYDSLNLSGTVNASNISGTTSGTNTGDQNLFETFNGDSGSTTANSLTDTLTVSGAGISTTSITGDTLTITSTEVDGSITNEIQDLWFLLSADSGSTSPNSATDTLTIAGGGINATSIVGDTLTITGTEVDGSITNELQNLWEQFIADSGNSTANSQTDSFTFTGGSGIDTSITGDALTIAQTGLANFASDSTIIYASADATLASSTNAGTLTEPVGPTIDDLITNIDSRPAGNYWVKLAPGSYIWDASASFFTSTRPTILSGSGIGSTTITASTDSAASENQPLKGMTDISFVYDSGGGLSNNLDLLSADLGISVFANLDISATTHSTRSSLRIGQFKRESYLINATVDCDFTFNGNLVLGLINENPSVGSGTMNLSGRDGVSNVYLKDLQNNSQIDSSQSTVANVFIEGNTSSIVLIDGDVSNVRTGGQINRLLMDFRQVDNVNISATDIFLTPQSLAGASHGISNSRFVTTQWTESSTRLTPILVDGVTLDSFYLRDSEFIHTGDWAETSDSGNPCYLAILDSDIDLILDGVSYGSKTNPSSILFMIHGFWNSSEDPTQASQVRNVSITNSEFHVTYQNTLNQPADPVGILYLMSMGEYLIQGNSFFLDGTNAQRNDSGSGPVYVRGVPSASTDTSVILKDNYFETILPAGAITNNVNSVAQANGKTGVIYVRDEPRTTEQTNLSTPILEAHGNTYIVTNQDFVVGATTGGSGLNDSFFGDWTGNTAMTIQNGTPTYRQSETGPINAVGTLDVSGLSTLAGDILTGDVQADNSGGLTLSNNGGTTVATFGAGGGVNATMPATNMTSLQLTTDLPITEGGTGASDAATARTNLGLGTIATQDSTSVNIDGGSIDGTTIGASSTSSGAFTTVNASGDITISAATPDLKFEDTGTNTSSGVTFDGNRLQFEVTQTTSSGDSNGFVEFDISPGGAGGGTFRFGRESSANSDLNTIFYAGDGGNSPRVQVDHESARVFPHTNGDGSLGTPSKEWGEVNAVDGNFSGDLSSEYLSITNDAFTAMLVRSTEDSRINLIGDYDGTSAGPNSWFIAAPRGSGDRFSIRNSTNTEKFYITSTGAFCPADLDVSGAINGGGAFQIDSSGFIRPITSTDASAPNNSIYFSSTASRLVYKDSGGTVNNLY